MIKNIDIIIAIMNILCFICVIILFVRTNNKDKNIKKMHEVLENQMKINIKLSDENIALKIKINDYENRIS